MFGLRTFFLSVKFDRVLSFFSFLRYQPSLSCDFLVEVEFQVILMVFTEGPVAPGEVDVFIEKTWKSSKESIKSNL